MKLHNCCVIMYRLQPGYLGCMEPRFCAVILIGTHSDSMNNSYKHALASMVCVGAISAGGGLGGISVVVSWGKLRIVIILLVLF